MAQTAKLVICSGNREPEQTIVSAHMIYQAVICAVQTLILMVVYGFFMSISTSRCF